MPDLLLPDRPRLKSAVQIGALFFAVCAFCFFLVPIHNDDAFITARYARNLAAGNGFVYNAGERVLGTTSPLLTVVLAAAMVPLPDELAFRMVSVGLFGLCSVAFLIYGRQFGQSAAGLAAGLLFPAVDWNVMFAGNETPLFTAIMLFGLVMIHDGRMKWAGIAAGLLPLARGEGIMFAPLLGLLAMQRVGWRKSVPFAVVVACMTLLYLGMCRMYFGEWFPRTLEIKRLQLERGTWHAFNPAEYFRASWLSLRSIYGPLAWLGAWSVMRRAGWQLVVWAVIHTTAYLMLRVANYPWYHYPIVAATVWFAACGVETVVMGIGILMKRSGAAWEVGSLSWERKRVGMVFGLALIVVGGMGIGVWESTRNKLVPLPESNDRYERYREIGEWLHEHGDERESVIMAEIGIVGFYAWPVGVLDVASLVHRDIPRERIGDQDWLTLDRQPIWAVSYYSHGRYLTAQIGERLAVYEEALRTRGADESRSRKQTSLYRLMEKVPEDFEIGFYPAEDWGGKMVRWSKRVADVKIPEGVVKFKIVFYVGHPGIAKTPVRVTFWAGGEELGEVVVNEKGGREFVGDASLLGGGDVVRIEVDRTWPAADGRKVGVAVYPVEAVE